jgi:transcriptional regulator with XRE-family HTH domain
MSQRRLAAAAGVSRITVIKIERGETRPTTGTISVLAQALGVPPMALVNDPPQGGPRTDDP